MENDDLKFIFAFNNFINYTFKYINDFNKFSNHVFGSFKTNHSDDISIFDGFFTGLNFKTSKFCDSFIRLIEAYVLIKLKEDFFMSDVLFRQVIIMLNTFIVFDFSNCDQKFNSSQIAKLSELCSELSNLSVTSQNKFKSFNSNNSARLNGIEKFERIDPTAFKDLSDCSDFISSFFNKVLRYTNHIQSAQSYIKNGTTPPALFYKNFPTPFLNDDTKFVNDYNALISKF